MPSGREKHGLLWGHKCPENINLHRAVKIVHTTAFLPSGCANSEDPDHLGMNY